jgi:hypothetical protein
MSELWTFSGAVRSDPEVEAWFSDTDLILRQRVRPWFQTLKACGDDTRELLHDGHPTACAGQVAFAYVDAFSAHASIGFFFGADLDDPARLLEGSGKRMRHVKLKWGQPVNEPALSTLITQAYDDIRRRLNEERA